MSKRVHASGEEIVSILQSSGGFKEITAGADFSAQARGALRKEKFYRPESTEGGFGSRPSFRLGDDFGTIKPDPNAYSKTLSGTSRKSEKQAARHARKMMARSHPVKRPKVSPEFVAKYSRKKTHPKPRVERATPSLALVYNYGPRVFSLKPRYSIAFKGPQDAARALKRGDLFANSLVHFMTPQGQPVFSMANRLEFFLNNKES